MRHFIALPLIATAMMLAGCEVKVSGNASADATTGDEAAAAAEAPAATEATADAAPAPAAPAAGGTWQRITITGYTCGDNCYVEYRAPGNSEMQTAMCETPLCNSWFEVQAMPDSEKGKSYDVQMGTADQVDGGGAVMESDFPAITAMRPAA
jgi:hypothetical protein